MKKFLLAIAWLLPLGGWAAVGDSRSGDSLPTFAADTMQLDEVSVTALKTMTLTTDRQLSVTTIGRDEAEQLGLSAIGSLSEIAPNFYMPDYGSNMTASIYVRGIGARIDRPVVAFNIDNVPVLNKDNYDFDIADMERIEVIRGPQCTLYGRSAMGGVVNIRTISPLRYQGLRVMASAGLGGDFRASVGYYGKLSPRLATSIALDGAWLDGFFTNDYNGRKADREESGGARWKIVWRPSSALIAENTAYVGLSRQHGYPYAFEETDRIAYNDTCFYRRTAATDALSLDWLLPRGIKLSSVSSFQFIDDNMTLDQDFLPLSYFTMSQKRHEWALTEDLIVKGDHGRWAWLGGLFGFWQRSSMTVPVTFKADGIEQIIEGKRNEMNPSYPISWDSDEFVLNNRFHPLTRGFAVYGRATCDITPSLTAALDLRLDRERTSLDYHSFCDGTYTILDAFTDPARPTPLRVEPADIDINGKLSQTFTQLLPKLTLTYRLRKAATLYATVGKGYKPGGFNTQMFSDVLQQKVMEKMGVTAPYDIDKIVSYRPEYSWNYEVGIRLEPTPDGLSGSLAAFYIDCRNQQLTVFPDGLITGRVMTNAGRSRSLGLEASLRWQPTERFAASASYGLTSARFVDYDDGKQVHDGKRVPYVPANTLFLDATYTLPLGGRTSLAFDLNCRGVGDICWDEDNLARQPFYALLGASITLSHGPLAFELWGKNLTATDYATFRYVSIGHTFYQKGRPTTAGLTFRYSL